jgi:hypothetical protein
MCVRAEIVLRSTDNVSAYIYVYMQSSVHNRGTQQRLSMRVSEVNAEEDSNHSCNSYYAVADSNHMVQQQ